MESVYAMTKANAASAVAFVGHILGRLGLSAVVCVIVATVFSALVCQIVLIVKFMQMHWDKRILPKISLVLLVAWWVAVHALPNSEPALLFEMGLLASGVLAALWHAITSDSDLCLLERVAYGTLPVFSCMAWIACAACYTAPGLLHTYSAYWLWPTSRLATTTILFTIDAYMIVKACTIFMSPVPPPLPTVVHFTAEDSGESEAVRDTDGDSAVCSTCKQARVAAAFMPCGCAIVCWDCASGVVSCAKCKAGVESSIRVSLR